MDKLTGTLEPLAETIDGDDNQDGSVVRFQPRRGPIYSAAVIFETWDAYDAVFEPVVERRGRARPIHEGR